MSGIYYVAMLYIYYEICTLHLELADQTAVANNESIG